ncbi:MAG: aspartate ammonia-lyase [Bacteroidota bacterium]|nr:aspartate ammonia-lyase [Bacteroidota bacterium]MDP4233011.1 aspartate ammonia-lyase [Bacteroidota bacterium]MDP4241844.1 aspartate ammonia-lyase [Bacteroidota bacterium]MDP4288393.1 aspartate ammonia-lyase [Bacteroidota bacterium]
MRTERDSLGVLELPDDAYYGIQTLRAVQNYPISGLKPHPTFVRAYALLKKACAKANERAGALKPELSKAICDVCDEIIEGGLRDQFVVDVFQAGAGTSTNMNTNEVISNRALEKAGKPRGAYDQISPNDHVNMSQSTNDSYPTAMRLSAMLMMRERMYPAIETLRVAFEQKATEFDDAVKSGRTHLQDAVPITLGQEFGAWATMMRRHTKRLMGAENDVAYLGIGGSAAGSGLNTPVGYRGFVVEELRTYTGLEVKEGVDLFELMQSLAPFVHLMGAMKNLALDIIKISGDLRMLCSGPMTGFAEVTLPAVQPGSSIMPGKVNPSILEMVSQVAMQVVGCEQVVSYASQGGQLELNVMMPVVQFNIAFAIEIFSNTLEVMARKCIDGIVCDRERMRHYAETSGSLVTALAPEIGYLKAAELAKASLKKRKTIRALVLEEGLMEEKHLDAVLDLKKMAKGN